MGDFGIKVAQPGYDVETASDNELLFSSSWPLLKIVYEGDYIISSDQTQTIYAHNLGFPCAFFICDYTSGYSKTNPTLNLTIGSNSSQLIYFMGRASLTFPISIHFYIFYLDLTKDFTGKIVSQSYETPGFRTTNIGIKVAKPGKNVYSTDLRDYSVHSGTQSPIIHQIVTETTQSVNSGGQNIQAIVAQHNLGYFPLFFPFVSDGSGNYFFTGNFTQSVPRVFGTTNQSQIELGLSEVTTNPATLIIFKDPYTVDIPNIVVNA